MERETGQRQTLGRACEDGGRATAPESKGDKGRPNDRRQAGFGPGDLEGWGSADSLISAF